MNDKYWIEWAKANPEKAERWGDSPDEVDREIAEAVLSKVLPQYFSFFAKIVEMEIIQPETFVALYDGTDDLLNRWDTYRRIIERVTKWISQENENLTTGGKFTELQKQVTEMSAMLQQLLSRHEPPPPLPDNLPPSPDRDGWDKVFDWYHKTPRGECRNLGELARKIGYAHGTVKKEHSLYRRKRRE